MSRTELAQKAYEFVAEFKAEIMRQVEHLNTIADGNLQDGFNPMFLEDGWVTLEGCSWGFVMLYDEPIRIDMTFGPDQPFVGHRITFSAKPVGPGLAWVQQSQPNEVYYGAQQLARYGLSRLAGKVGENWLFELPAVQIQQQVDEPLYALGLENQSGLW